MLNLVIGLASLSLFILKKYMNMIMNFENTYTSKTILTVLTIPYGIGKTCALLLENMIAVNVVATNP